MPRKPLSSKMPEVDPLDDPVRHGAADPPRDPLADAARNLVVDDHEGRLGQPAVPDAAAGRRDRLPDAEPGST